MSAPSTTLRASDSFVDSPDHLLTEILRLAGYSFSESHLANITYEKIILRLGVAISLEGSDPGSDRDRLSMSDFYLIASGKVRLLGFNEARNRWMTLKVLDSGEWFGADALFQDEPISYQAIGASTGVIFRLSGADLSALLKRHPNLERYFFHAIHQHQRLTFFRKQPSLREFSGRQVRSLAQKTTEINIPAHTALATNLANQSGFFWLRSGTVCRHPDEVLAIGTSWRNTDLSSHTLEAKTDTLVYYLSDDAFEEEGIEAAEFLKGTSSAPLSGQLNGKGLSAISPHVAHSLPPSFPNSQEGTTFRDRSTTSVSGTKDKRSLPVIFPKPFQRKVLDQFHQFPWVEQQSSSDCGAACLAMIARYWGKRLPVNMLREKANVGRSGASLKGLARGAESIGLHARPVRASFSRIAEQTNPWIAHWQGDHYVVVYKVERGRVVIADPALGRQSISADAFKANWTGYGLLLEPTERLQDVEAQQASLGRYARLLTPYRSLIFQILLVSLLIQVFSLVTPLFTQIILDKVVVQKSMPTLNVFAFGLLVFSIWAILMGTIRSYLLAYFSMRLDLTMVSGFIKHAISLPLKFYETRRVGDILTRVQENRKVQRFLIGQVMLAWLGFLTGFVYLGLMLYYNLQLTMMVLTLIPAIVIITLVSTPFLRKISREIFKEAANQNSTLVETINGIAAVKSAGVEQEVRWRWEDSLIQLKNVSFKGQKFGIGLGAVNGSINTLGSTALLWLGAAMVIREELTIGQFVAFNMMIGYVLSPVIALANLWDELQEIFISIERLNDVFETEPEEPLSQSMLILPTIEGKVIFDKVTFRYDDDADSNTLETLSFQAEAGQTIAIVGRSGSGKTTLVKLIEGLYHPTQGRIFIDDHDISHISLHSLRTQLGVVPQECFLFSGTILENITLYRDGYDLEQVIKAAKLAEAHAFIQELPLGYSTKVGERGSTLSGGQRQRIAIARALLGDPRILILDEATSSLDTESEKRFQRNLSQISRDRTTFIIAHRLSTVRNADRILVLDRGILVEEGNHEELVKLKGIYFNLAQQQLDI